jgi:mRNA interferase MazF
VIRGAVYPVNLGQPRGHEQGGKRYGLVLSPSEAPWTVVTIVPTSTSAAAMSFRPEFEVAGTPTVFLVDQMRAVDVDYFGAEPIDYLPADELAAVEEAVARYLGILPDADV